MKPGLTESAAVDFSLARGDGRRGVARDQIVQAAHDLLTAGASFSDLAVGRIAERAGVSRATFYLHFGDKRELLGALAQRELTQWREVAEPLFDDPDSGYEQLLETMTALFAVWEQQRAVISALIELAEYDDLARDAWRAVIETVGAMVAQYARGRADVEVDDYEVSGRMIAWTAERVCHKMLEDATADERAAIARSLAQMIWRARKPNP